MTEPGLTVSPGLQPRKSRLRAAAEHAFLRSWAWADGAEVREPLALSSGVLLAGRYRPLSLLGQGGFGRVLKVLDTLENREIALKVMAPRSADSHFDARLEFHALSRLQHPGTATVFDVGSLEGDLTYIAMELLDGEDLSVASARARLPLPRVCDVLEEVATVLGFIHSRLLVHCDVKAENIRLTGAGRAKLMDFGLMHPLGTPAGGDVRGTPKAMAPEMLVGRVIDERTDLYALGVMAFELLTGRPPYRGDDTALVTHHLKSSPPKPSSFGPDVPVALDDLVVSCLAKDPANRPQSAQDFLQRLAEAAGRPLATVSLERRSSYLRSAELLGRDAERARLEAALAQAERGHGHAVFLAAPGGIGKSRLVSELLVHAKLRSVRCFAGRCLAEGLGPLGPLRQALAPLVMQLPKDALAEVGDALTPLLPTLEGLGFHAQHHEDPLQERAVVFRAIVAALRAAATQKPLVVLLEDLHWADAGTLQIVNGLAREVLEFGVLLLATYRPGELTQVQGLSCLENGVAEVITLGPLKRDELEQMIHQMLNGPTLTEEVFSALHQATGGNCFFATESLRAAIEQDLLTLEGGRWRARSGLALPRTIDEAIAGRLASLSPKLKALTTAAAVSGRVLDLELLCSVLGMDPGELYAHLDDMVERQFVAMVEGKVFFTHDHVRSALYGQTPQAERAQLHQKLGEALERRYPLALAERASVLAHHFVNSADAERAVRYLTLSGEVSLQRGSQDDAARAFAAAARWLEGVEGPAAQAQRISLWVRIVDSTFVGEPGVAVTYATRLLEVWSQSIDEDRAARQLAWVMRLVNGLPSGLRRAMKRKVYQDRPFSAGDTSVMAVFPRLLQYRAIRASAYVFLSRWSEAEADLTRNLALLPDLRSVVHGATLASKAMMLVLRGEYEESGAICRQAQQVCEENQETITSRLMSAAYSAVLSLTLMRSNSVGEALDEQLRQRAQELSERLHLFDFKFYSVMVLHQRACITGNAADYRAGHALTLEVMRQLGYQAFQENRIALYDPLFHLEQGALENADHAIDSLERTGRWLNDRLSLVLAQIYRAWATLERGQPGAALEALAEPRRRCEEEQLFPLNQAMWLIARCLLRLGRVDEARAYLEAQVLPRFESPNFGGPLFAVIGRRLLAEATGGERAVALAGSSLELAKAHGLTLHEGLAHQVLAELSLPVAPERARLHLDAAERIFTDIENTPQRQRTAALRARLPAGGH